VEGCELPGNFRAEHGTTRQSNPVVITRPHTGTPGREIETFWSGRAARVTRDMGMRRAPARKRVSSTRAVTSRRAQRPRDPTLRAAQAIQMLRFPVLASFLASACVPSLRPNLTSSPAAYKTPEPAHELATEPTTSTAAFLSRGEEASVRFSVAVVSSSSSSASYGVHDGRRLRGGVRAQERVQGEAAPDGGGRGQVQEQQRYRLC
jgi:hypothetical protein